MDIMFSSSTLFKWSSVMIIFTYLLLSSSPAPTMAQSSRCLPIDYPCHSNAECCSGICPGCPVETVHFCRSSCAARPPPPPPPPSPPPPPPCLPFNGVCTTDSQCCSELCVFNRVTKKMPGWCLIP